MQTCRYCGADLPANTRFCGKCGSVQDTLTTHMAAPTSTTPQPPSWAPAGGTLPATWPPYSTDPTQATWSPNGQAPITPPPVAANKDERRRGVPPWSPQYGAGLGADALLGSGQPYTPGAPGVQGTPQIGSVPSGAGSPTPYPNAPVGHPTLGAGNAAPVSHPVQMPGNVSISHPVQAPANAAPVGHPAQWPVHTPVSHPIQGPSNAPHPQPGPQPIHYPPEPPGTQQHHPIHKHHQHHAQHVHHAAAHATKVTGGSSVKTIMIVVLTIVVVAAGGIAAAAHFRSGSVNVTQLAPAYQGTGHNITYNITSNFALASVKEDGQGNISGNAIWTPPLYGTGPFTGKVNADNSLVFTSTSKDGSGFTITYTGKVNADGSLSGNYTVSSSQIGTWHVSSSS